MEVTCYCCCSRGAVGIQGSFEKDIYTNGEVINLIANVNNQSSVDCKIFGEAFISITLTNGFRYFDRKISCGKIVYDKVLESKTNLSNIPLSF